MSQNPDAPQAYDAVIQQIAQYVATQAIASEDAYTTAHRTLLDALGCAMLSLRFPECVKLLGPTVPGTVVPHGARVPGTPYVLDPVQAAFNTGLLIRWLDYNDTWLAAEWGHPSDNLGGILALADFLSQQRVAQGQPSLLVRDVLRACIQAHEIQGVLALTTSLNRAGMDHAVFVRVATAAVATGLLGGSEAQIADAVSQAWTDGGPLRVYRHAPNTGSRKSWAAGDATSRGVWLALLTMRGEMGYPTALTTPTWGFNDALFRGKAIELERPLGSYVMENVLFKVAYPAEFHAQTAVEAAIRLHPQVAERVDQIARVVITTQESAMRIINKTRPLRNPADRDHCIQYMTAIGLLFGALTAEDYDDARAADPRIDALRAKTEIMEDPQFSHEYLDPDQRSIANAVQVFFTDGSATDQVAIHFPLGHRRRRAEALPLLAAKLHANLATRFPALRVAAIKAACQHYEACVALTVPQFMDLWV